MDEKCLRIVLKVLGAVKDQYPDTKGFIEDSIQQECLQENMYVEEVIFLQV